MSKLKNQEYEIFNDIVSRRLKKERQTNRNNIFSFRILKELHDKTFEPHPDFPENINREMQRFYVMRPAVDGWGKIRQVKGVFPYRTMYSSLTPADYKNTEVAIQAARPENMRSLPLKEKIEKLAAVYAEIDYLHAFGDGNSRVNRIFLSERARTSNVHLDWEKVAHNEMYVARDKSPARLNLLRHPEILKAMPEENSTAFMGQLYVLKDLNAAYPEVTLNSVINNIATELNVQKKQAETEKVVDSDIYEKRIIVQSTGIVKQQKTNNSQWQTIENLPPVQGMSAGVHYLSAAKPVESSKEYSGEIVYINKQSAYQKTKYGLIIHPIDKFSETPQLGKKYIINDSEVLSYSVVKSRTRTR